MIAAVVLRNCRSFACHFSPLLSRFPPPRQSSSLHFSVYAKAEWKTSDLNTFISCERALADGKYMLRVERARARTSHSTQPTHMRAHTHTNASIENAQIVHYSARNCAKSHTHTPISRNGVFNLCFGTSNGAGAGDSWSLSRECNA